MLCRHPGPDSVQVRAPGTESLNLTSGIRFLSLGLFSGVLRGTPETRPLPADVGSRERDISIITHGGCEP